MSKYIDLQDRVQRGIGDKAVLDGIEYALNWLDIHPGLLPPQGTRIDPNDIRKGDRYRVEWDSDHTLPDLILDTGHSPTEHRRHALEKTSDGRDPRIGKRFGETTYNVKFYLIERHKPTEAEKLEELMSGHISLSGDAPLRTLAEYLVAHGVKVGDES